MTIDQLNIDLNNLANCVGANVNLVPPLEFARGAMLFRIHNKAEDVNNTAIGEPKAAKSPHVGVYGQSHGRRRAKAGRQTTKKDLEFKGDLRRSLVTGTTAGFPSLGFSNDQSRVIAEAQQEQTGKTIWGLNKANLDEFNRQVGLAIDKDLEECL